MAEICGPWEHSPFGGSYRRCTANSTNFTPAEAVINAPERKDPPAAERIGLSKVARERIDSISRALVLSALREEHS